MTRVRAAAVQLSPVLYSREGTIDKVVRTIADLGRRGVHFATFPETVVPYYPYFSFIQEMVRACAPSTARSAGSANWRAGSTTTHWRATP
nr:nitrilase-related carbon-nitrogen hydrolase [Luteitalea pratensis]